MYDFAHAISDAVEGITHSCCTLEFADHRPLYDWTIDQLIDSGLLPYKEEKWRPNQIEFSRLNIQYTVLSKRKLIQLVNEKHVDGWDDPRMPTIAGIRNRGYPASAVRLFCDRVGISKSENNIDLTVLEDCVREVLEDTAPRVLAVVNPLRVKITNWNENPAVSEGVNEEILSVENHPKRNELGSRSVFISEYVFIDHDDFFDTGEDGKLSPPKGYKRLIPGE
jgi:glutaminyl-tRNA synthetase